jgi:hypothetical protein
MLIYLTGAVVILLLSALAIWLAGGGSLVSRRSRQ